MLKEMMVNSIIQYIEDNLESHIINIEELVIYSGFSRRYLQLTFKEYIQIPIGKYIRQRRASRAAALLRLTNIPIIDIAERFFYDSQQSFTREFKKIMGYTPKQYRSNSFWSFNNLLGRRKINTFIPIPRLCFLRERYISGKCYDHKELILYTGVNSQSRWGGDYLKKNDFLKVSNKIPFCEKSNNILARTVVWTHSINCECEIKIDKGLYAHFTFSGTLDEYMDHMYNVYYNSLPVYNLNKRDTYDIEIIRKNKDGTFLGHYFLPINNND